MKFCVIGLGRFGEQVAITLAENGKEVLAIDSNETIVASIRDQVSQAICMRVTDEISLRNLGVQDMDTAIVATGENFAQSILVTALLKKKLHVPVVIARGINEMHKEILQLIGADRVILPEKEIGVRLADSLSSPFTNFTRLSEDFSVSHIIAPEIFVGKKLSAIDLYKKYSVRCIGVKTEEDNIALISSDYEVKEGDKLVFVGLNENLERISDL